MGLSRSQLATVLCGGRKYICLVGRRYEILCSDSVLPVSLLGFRSTPILIRFSCIATWFLIDADFDSVFVLTIRRAGHR
jgi:hypothetical protein